MSQKILQQLMIRHGILMNSLNWDGMQKWIKQQKSKRYIENNNKCVGRYPLCVFINV